MVVYAALTLGAYPILLSKILLNIHRVGGGFLTTVFTQAFFKKQLTFVKVQKVIFRVALIF
jgi:hypothetical protein